MCFILLQSCQIQYKNICHINPSFSMLPQINYRLTQKLTYGKNIGAGLLMKMVLRRCDRCGFSVLSLFFNVWVFRRADAMITDKRIIIKKCCNVMITYKKNNIKEIAIMFITNIRNEQDKFLLYPREMLTFNKNKRLPRLIPKATFTKSNFKLITSPYHITKRSFSSLRILHTTPCSLHLSNSNFLWSFSRRFYPNKPTPGHAHKVVALVNKSKPPNVTSSHITSIQQTAPSATMPAHTPTTPPEIINTFQEKTAEKATKKALESVDQHQQMMKQLSVNTITEKTWFNKDENLTTTQLENEKHVFSKAIQNYASEIVDINIDFNEITETELSFATQETKKINSTEFVGIKLKEDARDANGQQLPPHELGKNAHVFIGKKDEVAGTIIAEHLLTSSNKNYVTGEPNTTIDSNNFKGQNKPQRIAELQTGRLFQQHDENKTFDIEEDATKYLQQDHIKEKLDAIITDRPKGHLTVRPHKDDPSLYTEDGLLHSDDEKVERGLWSFKESSQFELNIKEENTPQNNEEDILNKEITKVNNIPDSVLEVD